jgi:Sulfotransferase family
VLPTFLIIGAAKAGTTSLYEYLRAQPGVHMSPVKEPRYFAPVGGETLDERHLALYEALFDSDAPVRGEASPHYTAYPRHPGVPERIQALVPGARFVYLVRDPVQRAVSHYLHAFLSSAEDRPAAEAFAELEDPYHEYACNSRYATQLERYLAVFPADRVLVVDRARLAANASAVVRDVLAFVGADPDAFVPAEGRRNVTEERARHHPLLLRLRYSRGARRLVDAVPPAARARALAAASTVLYRGRTTLPEVPSAVVERLARHLAPEVRRLRELTGQDFPTWSV